MIRLGSGYGCRSARRSCRARAGKGRALPCASFVIRAHVRVMGGGGVVWRACVCGMGALRCVGVVWACGRAMDRVVRRAGGVS